MLESAATVEWMGAVDLKALLLGTAGRVPSRGHGCYGRDKDSF